MNVSIYFSSLKNALETRNEAIRTALEGYRTEASRVTSRYSESVAGEELARLEQQTRQTIEEADKIAHDEAEATVESLREKLADYINTPADPGLLAQLQAVQTCGLKLSRSEVESMASRASDPISLACLAQTAEKSGFAMTFTTSKELEDDLKRVLSMFTVPSHYTPDDLISEGLKCHPNKRYAGVDGGRPDVLALTIRMKPHQDAPGQLDEMGERWDNAGAVELKELAPV